MSPETAKKEAEQPQKVEKPEEPTGNGLIITFLIVAAIFGAFSFYLFKWALPLELFWKIVLIIIGALCGLIAVLSAGGAIFSYFKDRRIIRNDPEYKKKLIQDKARKQENKRERNEARQKRDETLASGKRYCQICGKLEQCERIDFSYLASDFTRLIACPACRNIYQETLSWIPVFHKREQQGLLDFAPPGSMLTHLDIGYCPFCGKRQFGGRMIPESVGPIKITNSLGDKCSFCSEKS